MLQSFRVDSVFAERGFASMFGKKTSYLQQPVLPLNVSFPHQPVPPLDMSGLLQTVLPLYMLYITLRCLWAYMFYSSLCCNWTHSFNGRQCGSKVSPVSLTSCAIPGHFLFAAASAATRCVCSIYCRKLKL
jgi:hypothetical protein